CCIAPACAIMSAASCWAFLALSKSPMALPPAPGTLRRRLRGGQTAFNQTRRATACTRARTVTRQSSAFAEHQAVDETTQRATHISVETVGTLERVTRLHRVIARDAERNFDCGRSRGERREYERARRVELLGVERTSEQLAQCIGFSE